MAYKAWAVCTVLLAGLNILGGVDCIPNLPSGQRVQIAGPDPEVKAFSRAGCDNFTGDVWQPLRPAYHITVPYGWMNDPHGMFQLNDTVHLFFQYNPRANQWGAPFWGHAVSKDMAHWTWLPPALLPDTDYDFNGVWSGAATVSNGMPVLTYTAAGTNAPEAGNFWQRQAMAVPADVSDPYLKKWVKPQTNPFLFQVPLGGTNFQFRDPTEARHAVYDALASSNNPRPLPKDHYALAVGVQQFCLGGAAIFTAPQMSGPWTYRGSLYNQLAPEPEVNGQCMAGRVGLANGTMQPAYGGPCDQFGARCRMWEVVDIAELEDGVYFLKFDDQSNFRSLFSMEWYVLGNEWNYAAVNPGTSETSKSHNDLGLFGLQYSEYYNGTGEGKASVPMLNRTKAEALFNQISNFEESVTENFFTGKLDGKVFAPMRYDYGSVYATMVFRPADRRQVAFSWIYETAAGCENSCSDQLPPVIEKQGFKGVLTMPRQLNYDTLTKTLRAYPVTEMEQLRGQQIYTLPKGAAKTLPDRNILVPVSTVPGWVNGGNNKLQASQVTARQFEIQTAFTLNPTGSTNNANSTSSGSSGGRTTTDSALRNRFKLQKEDFAVGVRLEFGNATYADAYLRGTVQDNTITNLSLWFDKGQAGGATNTTWLEGGPVPLPADSSKAWKVPGQPLELSVWVDHGVVEIFALKGLGRLTSRVYPTDDSVAWGASAFVVPPESGEGWGADLDAQAWEMKSTWLAPSC